MEKTFSFLVKKEILEVERTQEEFSLLLDAIAISNGKWNNGKLHIKIIDEELRTLLAKKIKEALGIKATTKDRDVIVTGEGYDEEFELDMSSAQLETVEEYRIYLTGLFFAKGYVNKPNSKYYHIEFRVKKLGEAFNVMELLNALEINAKQHLKNGWHYVYNKRYYDISEMLKYFGAVTAAGHFDTIKIEKDFNSAMEQRTALDVSNQAKIAEASVRQCRACEKVLDRFFEYNLNGKHRVIAELRIQNPEMSLTDLAYEYTIKVLNPDAMDEEITRQTVSRWLKDIEKEAMRK